MRHDDYVPDCGRCGMPAYSRILGTGICTPCHNRLYGVGHRPSALRFVEPGSTTYVPHCLGPCDVLDGLKLLPHTTRDDAVEESRRLHREAIHGPDEPGTLGPWQAAL